jgi:beta-lactamase superfamily II metal-dependent hydrolase
MNRPSLVVLDVGHGNAAVLLDKGGVVVIDAGKGGVLLDFLKEMKINRVDVLLISHADTDHVRNAPDLLLDDEIEVGLVCYNSDASKQSQVWKLFRKAIKTARRKDGTVAEPQLTISQTGRLDRGVVRVEVLYPFPEMAASAAGGKDEDDDPLTSNSMSAVIRLVTSAGPMVMMAGDVESGVIKAWKEEGVDPTAKVLVFPHHGGNPGKDNPVTFAVEMTKAVRPETVIFSIHRTQYELPIPDVVEAVRRNVPGVRIACTQLSAHCSAAVPAALGAHLTPHAASGKPSNSCCAGTVVIDLSGGAAEVVPPMADHAAFIDSLGGDPLCRRAL